MDEGGETPFTGERTLGIEEEFYLVDDDGRPADGTDELCYQHEPPEILKDRLDHELFTFVIETQTPVIESLDAAPAILTEIRSALVDYAADHGYGIAAAGLHPTARWREHNHVDKPRYQRQLDRIQFPQHRNITAGLHLHVGVGDAERAVWIANEIRWYLPIILAISANSPFWNGYDTGLSSARASIFESLPNTGMPTAFDDYGTYRRLEQVLLETDSIRDRGEIWFDVRPHTEYGTVEVRTPDAQADTAVVLALAEYVYRLVEALDEGHRSVTDADQVASESIHADWATPPADGDLGAMHALLSENKWRAIRYGQDASFIDRSGRTTVSFETAVRDEIDRLDLRRLDACLSEPSGTERQRAALEAGGPSAVCDLIRLE